MKKAHPAAFEALRAKLRKAGCRVTALDDAIMAVHGDGGRRPTHADTLIELAGGADLFPTADGIAFVDLDLNGHQAWHVRSKGFTHWLTRQFYEATHRAPNSEALQSTLNVVKAKAKFDAPERSVFTRVGSLDERLYLVRPSR